MSRYVDSSVERIQVEVTGYNPARHAITCNNRLVPVHATGSGTHAGGVRYKAWQPWRGLHPTIPVHAPSPSTSSTAGMAARLAVAATMSATPAGVTMKPAGQRL